jgi:hypothetical protein
MARPHRQNAGADWGVPAITDSAQNREETLTHPFVIASWRASNILQKDHKSVSAMPRVITL